MPARTALHHRPQRSARPRVEERFAEYRHAGIQARRANGIELTRVTETLRSLGLSDPNCIGAVWALLDDTLPSQFPGAEDKYRLSHGATTAQVASHIGILQFGLSKLDREGRDAWIKPLREIGAVEKVLYVAGDDDFVPGHPVAKSPYCAYRLAAEFFGLLSASDAEFPGRLTAWASADTHRERLRLQADAERTSAAAFGGGHAALLRDMLEIYAPRFLDGFILLYTDDGDGDRLTDVERSRLAAAGIELTLADKFPDAILLDPRRGLWCLEAVVSDGEVDVDKARELRAFAERSGLRLAGLTTGYTTRKDWYRRQSKRTNLAPGTYIWTADDPGVQHRICLPSTEGRS